MVEEAATKDLVTNRRAWHDYEIIEKFETGISLLGTEIKSLRANGGSLQEAYVKVIKSEVWLIGSSIVPYRYGNVHNHEERRDRKLLLHKREIAKLHKAVQEKGLTIVPLKYYLKCGRVKLLISIARGKKLADKRHDLKQKDDLRHMQKTLKESHNG